MGHLHAAHHVAAHLRQQQHHDQGHLHAAHLQQQQQQHHDMGHLHAAHLQQS